ncbi:hypothetical protein ACFQ1I_00905 [Kitasatospora arboriphila]
MVVGARLGTGQDEHAEPYVSRAFGRVEPEGEAGGQPSGPIRSSRLARTRSRAPSWRTVPSRPGSGLTAGPSSAGPVSAVPTRASSLRAWRSSSGSEAATTRRVVAVRRVKISTTAATVSAPPVLTRTT